MKKSYFLSVCGGLTLMSAVAANVQAQPLFQIGPNGLQGYLEITNFTDGDNQFDISLSQASGYQGNNPATITFSNVASTSNPLSYSGNPLRFYHSPTNTNPNTPTGPFVNLLDGVFFQGTSSFTTGVSSLTFGDPGVTNSAAIGQSMTLTLNGQLQLPVVGALPINSSLNLLINDATSSSLSISATETVAGSGPSWREILLAIDQIGTNPGIINGIVTVANSTTGGPSGGLEVLQVPEPASLALLSAGLFGLGWTRRMKKAA